MPPFRLLLALLTSITPATLYAQESRKVAAAYPETHVQLVALFKEWRSFVQPEIKGTIPDYSIAAMAHKSDELPRWRARLLAIDRAGWSARAQSDYRLIEAEMNGFDFHLRVLKPWARDPGFYQTLFGEQSDVPAHEGPSAQPNIDLFDYSWPLSRSADAKLTKALATIPVLLTVAKTNLAGSRAHDLWTYGDRSFREQSRVLEALAKGTLTMRTLDGQVSAKMKGQARR